METTYQVPNAYDEDLDEIVSCDQRGTVCVIEVPPGADRSAIGHALSRRGTLLALCYHNVTRNSFAEFGRSELIAALVAQWLPMPFVPVTEAQRRRLRLDAERLLIRAARDVGWDITKANQSTKKLAKGVRASISWALQEVPTTVVRRFWEIAARSNYEQIYDLIADLANHPNPVLEMISTIGIERVVFPDGDLLDSAQYRRAVVWDLACGLAKNGVQTAVITDPRSRETPLSMDERAHAHVLTTSLSAPSVLAVLSRTETAKNYGYPMHTKSKDAGIATSHLFGSRETLIVSLAASLEKSQGVQVVGESEWLGGAEACELGLGDLRGQTVLLVTPRESESSQLAGQLSNYIEPRAQILGEGGLWRKGAELLEHVLDPCGLVSGDAPSVAAAAVDSARFIATSWWERLNVGRQLAKSCLDVIDTLNSNLATTVFEGEEAYCGVVRELGDALVSLAFDENRAVADWAYSLEEHLGKHLELLEVGDVLQLCDFAHEIGDLRATGFLQAASGSQRWVPRASSIRHSGDDRLLVAQEIDRQLRRHRPIQPIEGREDGASLYVTHIQRTGMDRADHVIICRTLEHHIPFTGRSKTGVAADLAAEDRMFYRAVSCARVSVHLLSVKDTPYFKFFYEEKTV